MERFHYATAIPYQRNNECGKEISSTPPPPFYLNHVLNFEIWIAENVNRTLTAREEK